METQNLLAIAMICLLLAGCYFATLRVFMQRSEVQNAFPAVTAILLVIYILVGGVLAFIAVLMGAELVLVTLIMMIALGTLCLSVLFVAQNFRTLHLGSLALLLCYLLAVAYITMFSRDSAGDHRISMIRTDLFVRAAQMHSAEPLLHVFLNIAMFLPVGFLLPLVQPEKLKPLTHVLFLSLTLSILIETVQLVLQIGQADLTDVLANTLGGIVGYLVCRLCFRSAFSEDGSNQDF